MLWVNDLVLEGGNWGANLIIGHVRIRHRCWASIDAGGSGSSSGGNTQKRSGRAGERSSPSEKRPRLDAQPQQPPQAREWADRLQKRQNCITFIRTTEGYQRLQLARQTEEATSAPTTPDPNDSTMSKRMWESSVQHFREDIRRWCERHPGTAPVPPQEPVEDEVEAIESQEP
mmetsp:Transcript_49118/g.104984  ORF Transcript_49118/g.104984 Transcript_49118/m.104984 type:complete len:173 (-) Transcript_49118:17-535(-)